MFFYTASSSRASFRIELHRATGGVGPEDPENPYNPAGSELFPFDQKLDSGFGVLLNAKRTEKIESNVSYQPH